MQFRGWGKNPKAITNSSIILVTLFMKGVGFWVLVGQLVDMYNDPNILVNKSYTFADNNI